MTKKTSKLKIRVIIYSYLLLKGDATAKEIADFIITHRKEYKLGTILVSGSTIAKELLDKTGVLSNVVIVDQKSSRYTYGVRK